MSVLYLVEQGAILRKRGDRVVVQKDGNTLLDVPCQKVDSILIFGAVQVTTQALAELLDHGIEVALLTRHGRLRGQLTPVKSKNVVLRMAQYDRSRDPAFALATAREMVTAKVQNGREVIRRFSYNHPEAALGDVDARLGQSVDAVARCTSIGMLDGVEGSAARDYFAAFARMLLGEFTFPGRERRPPTDPVNALLSFGYTLLANELHSLLDAIGFDPYIGFLHQPDYGRPSLALDLAEEFRHPLVDRFTLNLLNLKVLAPADFVVEAESGAVHLAAEAMKTYFRHFEEFMLDEKFPSAEGERTSFRRMLQLQAQALARALQGGEPYAAFRYGSVGSHAVPDRV